MHSIHYQALREAAQNYQSMLAWYEAIPDSPDAEVNCDEALAAFKRQIRHREVILSPICWMNWKPQKSVLQNWRKRKKRLTALLFTPEPTPALA